MAQQNKLGRANSKDKLTPEQEASRKYRLRRIYRRSGQVLMIVGALVLIQHWLVHLEAFGPGQPPLWMNLVSGYPTGAVLLFIGAILAGTKPKMILLAA